MKVVVIGGSGPIGSKVVARLAEQGHEAIAASPKSGVNTLTGQGRYFGVRLQERVRLPSVDALTLGPRFDDWLLQTAPQQ
jgi:nucleoside-diphosphate-sugar epimerase